MGGPLSHPRPLVGKGSAETGELPAPGDHLHGDDAIQAQDLVVEADAVIAATGFRPDHAIAAELAHPEPGYVVVGMKSYGRAPTFLLATGYQQVRSVVAALAGDRVGAARCDQGRPAAVMCAVNRDLLASAQRRRQLVPSIPGAPSGTTVTLGGTAADWSDTTCCP